MNQLLATKLFIPRSRANAVMRSHLIARLQMGRQGKLTLISAPAGFGKTSLVAQWVNQLPDTSCAWLSLDKGDDLHSRFITYLIAALQTVDPQLGASLLPLIRDGLLSDMSEIITTLVNQLTSVRQPLILVLDDYHLITNSIIHDALTFLLKHMPPTLHLVLLTREDPSLPLYRWRGQGQMTELRAADLRFSKHEAALFLGEVMQVKLSVEEVSILEERTEGWITSLQLAALALKASPSTPHAKTRHEFITSFSGSHRYVADYLVGEVLQQQPPVITHFLLETAHLTRLSASLCDYVRQQQDSQSLLERLERSNLFVIPLDHERHWYRYHHLFAELLSHRMQKSQTEVRNTLNHRASEWYEQHNFIEEAISHALLAKAHLRAVELIEKSAHLVFSSGKMEMVQRWVAELPAELIHSRPRLYLLQGWLLFRTGQFDRFKRHLQLSLPTNEAGWSESMSGEWLVLRAQMALIEGEFTRCIQLVKQGLLLLTPEQVLLRMPALALQAWSYEMQHDLSAAMACHLQAFKIAEETKSLTGIIATAGSLVQLYALQQETEQASRMFEQAKQTAEQHQIANLPLLGLAYLGMGRLCYQQHQSDEAQDYLKEAITRCQRWGGLSLQVVKAYLLLAQVLRSAGKAKQADSTLAQAKHYIAQQHLPNWMMSWFDNPPPIASPIIKSDSPLIDPLTTREQDVLRLMNKGRSSPQIAEELILGVSTVRTHIKRIYSKLDVHSRHEALTQARKHGLL